MTDDFDAGYDHGRASCQAEIERLREAVKGAKIALVRDGNVTAAAEILMRADEQRAAGTAPEAAAHGQGAPTEPAATAS